MSKIKNLFKSILAIIIIFIFYVIFIPYSIFKALSDRDSFLDFIEYGGNNVILIRKLIFRKIHKE